MAKFISGAFAVVVLMAVWWVAAPATAQTTIYEPASIAQILLNAPISEDHLLWAETPVQVAPEEVSILYQIEAYWASGLVYFQVFASSEEAQDSSLLRSGLRMDLDEVPGSVARVHDLGGHMALVVLI